MGDAEIEDIIADVVDNAPTPEGLDQWSYDKGIEFGFRKAMELNSNSINVDALLIEWKKALRTRTVGYIIGGEKFADFIKKQINK